MFFSTVVELFIRDTQQPLPGVKVALYDRDRQSADDLLGEATTNRDGQARFRFSTRDFADRFGLFDDKAFTFPHFNPDRLPDLYVVVHDPDDNQILSTKRRTQENTVPITLPVPVSREFALKHGLIEPSTWSNVGNWFTDRSNLPHTASMNSTLTLPLVKRWQVQLGGSIIASAAGGHSHVYIGSGDEKLYALNPEDGSTVWATALGDKTSSAVTAIEEKDGSGAVFVTAEDGSLYSLNPYSGSQNWSRAGGIGSFISSTNYATGRVYYVYMSSGVSSELCAVNAQNGQVIWTTNHFNITTATPMHGFGSVYLGIAQIGQIYQRFDDGSGNLDWTYSDNDNSAASYTSGVLDMDVEVGEPARVYVSTRRGSVRALNAANGAQIWESTLPFAKRVYGFALTQNRTENVLIVSQQDCLYALDPKTGAIQWQQQHDTNSISSVNRRTPQPAIWGDYVIQVTGSNKLVAFDLSSGSEDWSFDLDGQTYASPMVAGETVYLGTMSGSMYAFSPAGPGGSTTCADFLAYPDNTQLGQSFAINGFAFTALGTASLPFVNLIDSNVLGLQFDPDGIRIDLPGPASEVTLQIGSYNAPLTIKALDSAGSVVTGHNLGADNSIHTVNLTAQGIVSIVITGGGFEGILGEICMTTP